MLLNSSCWVKLLSGYFLFSEGSSLELWEGGMKLQEILGMGKNGEINFTCFQVLHKLFDIKFLGRWEAVGSGAAPAVPRLFLAVVFHVTWNAPQ